MTHTGCLLPGSQFLAIKGQLIQEYHLFKDLNQDGCLILHVFEAKNVLKDYTVQCVTDHQTDGDN